MNTHTLASASQQPSLIDYMSVAEAEQLDLELRLYVGAFEVGLICLRAGVVTHAELPGAQGDAALALIARLPNLSPMPEPASERPTTVAQPWRELIDEDLWRGAAGRSTQLAQARSQIHGQLGAVTRLAVPEASAAAASPAANDRARQVTADLLGWAAIEAYLAGQLERAHSLAVRRAQLSTDDVVGAANVERLRLRLLENEITASLTGDEP